jgi:hypothetical protein
LKRKENPFMRTIAEIIGGAQALLPLNYEIQECFEETPTQEQLSFIHHLRVLMEHAKGIDPVEFNNLGRPSKKNSCYFKAFLAKSFFRMETTTDLICRLKSDTNLRLICGFSDKKGLSGASFSRRNALFAEEKLAETLHEQVVTATLADSIVGDINRDSTAIATREKPINKKKDAKIKPKKRGRPKKGEKRTKELTVIEKQATLSLKEALALVNLDAAWGGKRNSAGNPSYWKGYKLHLDVTDYGLPVTAIVSGANVHDSQLAIPMEQISSSRINYCYSLMDSAYNSPVIEDVCKSLGHVAVIDPKKTKNKEKIPLEPAKAERYKIRTTVERANSHLKDSFLSKRIYVRGSPKVTFQLMCGVLCLTAQKILQYFILPELEKTVAA